MQIRRSLLTLALVAALTGSSISIEAAPPVGNNSQQKGSKRSQNSNGATNRDTNAGEGPTAAKTVTTPTTPPKVIEIPNDKLLPVPDTLPTHINRFEEIGRGTAVIFTPDLAGEANRQFYQSLGFLYLEDTNWSAALDRVLAYNAEHKDAPITRLLLEAHGSWGDGLKLQAGKDPRANRSYISLGALQEKLENSGIKECIISACNSGRLYRPEIYRRLNTAPLQPANQGVVSSSKNYKPSPNTAKILRRRESRFEALTPLFVSEMPRPLRELMGVENGKAQFVVSDLFLEFILNDPNLQLINEGFVRQVTIYDYSVDRSELLIKRFLALLTQIAQNKTSNEQLANTK